MTARLHALRTLVDRHRRETGAVTAGLAIVLFAFAAIAPRHAGPDAPTAVVTRAPFTETVVEAGTIGAERLMIYASRMAGAQAKIVELVPEGTAVRAGDVLVRFDATPFAQALAAEEAALRETDAELLRAREEVRLETLHASGALDAARRQVRRAEQGLVNQVDGKGRLEIAEADAAASEASREADRARTGYEDLKPLFAEGFVTRAELDRAAQAWRRAEEQKRLADARRDTLVTYERPAATSLAEGDVQAAKDGLAREREAEASRRAERDAAVGVAAGRDAGIRARIAQLQAQIAATVLRAEAPGLVVYRDLYFGSDRRKPQVGDEVWPNQPLIAVPDSSQLIVDTRVREVDLHKIAASQRVRVTVDAYPDIRLPASVALVGALAQDDATRAGTKFFPVTIRLLAGDSRLRTGMTARVEIQVASIRDALVVPVEAIFDDRGAPSVLVARDGRADRRAVSVRATNDTSAAIAGPIAAGDRVLLADPTRP